MDRRTVLLVALVATLVTGACAGIKLPQVNKLETGPTVTKEIDVPLPDGGGDRAVAIVVGAGQLSLKPGAETALVEGQVTYNIAEFEPQIITDDDEVRIEQGKAEGIPVVQNIKNDWDLKLGSTPMALTITAGAAAVDIELGGLALTDLTVTQGASTFALAFSEPNQADIDTLRINAGASNMTLDGLANANAGQIVFKGGAGSYTLHFDGDLVRDVDVSIDAGLGKIVVIVPEGVAAEVSFQGAMSDVDAVHEWQHTGTGYELEGQGHKITLQVKMGAGSLELRNK